jgi:hypothetical protein
MDSETMEMGMRNFLIHKNLSLYYLLRSRIGKERALRVANTLEKLILNIDICFAIIFYMIAGTILFWFILVGFLGLFK